MPGTTTTLALAAGAAMLAGGAALALPTQAAGPGVKAPITAYANVTANGRIKWGWGIGSVTKPSAGIYCVRANRADISKTFPEATAVNYGRVVSIIAEPHKDCGNRNDTYRVTVYNADTRKVTDGGFYITVVP
ncbi:hypothetical protein AB0L06_34010 [Spirillospora sp. NPDC052269]